MAWAVNDLGFLSGGTYSIALHASADGSVIVGQADTGSSSGLSHAFRWTSGGGMQDLGTLPGGTYSIAHCCSDDGSVIFGEADTGDGVPQAMMWTSGGGMVGLGFLEAGTQSIAYRCSGDGSVCVGFSTILPGTDPSLVPHPFRWTSGVMSDLGILPGNAGGLSIACDQAGDAVGGGASDLGSDQPWLWTSGGGLSAISVPLGFVAGQLQGLANDGLSGCATLQPSVGNTQAASYTAMGGCVAIGQPSPATYSTASDCSGNGSIIVATGSADMRPSFMAYFQQANAFTVLPDLSASTLGSTAWSISRNGTTIVGSSHDIGNAVHAVYWSNPTPPPPVRPSNTVEPTSLARWRGSCGLNWLGMALVGDAFSNVVGVSDLTSFREYGNFMRMEVSTPPIQRERKRVFIPRFEIMMQVGEGLPDDPTTAPQIGLDFSVDGGMTWSETLMFRSMGAVGEYLTRIQWRKLGSGRLWILRLSYSDSARPALIQADADVLEGLG